MMPSGFLQMFAIIGSQGILKCIFNSIYMERLFLFHHLLLDDILYQLILPS